ncbi:HU family DNA-binding protein [Candidatus Electronema sp. JM]|uniref:HU family DNA-binding protein n=1 Tax=Candidatus Electronema sp. JM TaxID=3401571 RepID=UPI003AA7BA55
MTKTELIERAAAAAKVSKKAAQEVLDSVLADIAQTAAEGGEVRLFGFGTFKNIKRQARICRNPQTGEQVQVAARTAIKFRPAKIARKEEGR